jgi:hypothetical protein
MLARFADVLYRTACLAAVSVGSIRFVVTATLALPDWTIATPIAAVGALVIWSFGRAARHFLTRH